MRTLKGGWRMVINPLQRAVFLSSAMIVAAALGAGAASAGGFGVREQSVYFMGSAFAGSAAGTDISSMFWNSAATAAKTGCNSSSNMTVIFGRAEESGQAGLFVTGATVRTSTDVGSDAAVPSSFTTCQLTDQLYVGLGMNAPF